MGGFGSKLTPQEQMKQYKREIDRACRELDRERRKLEQQQVKIEQDIKKAAKENQMAAVRIMAKDYVRSKKHVQKFMLMRTQLQGVGLQLQTMKSADAMQNAMRNATRAMVAMNRRLNLPQLQAIMRGFAIENEKMEMTQEMMNDAVDDVLDGDEDEEEEDTIVKQVMEELRLTSSDAMPTVPVGASVPAAANATAAAAAPAKVAAATTAGGGGGGPTSPAGGAGGGGGFSLPSAPTGPPKTGGGGGDGDGGGAAGGAGAGGGGGSLQDRLNALRKG